MVFFFDACLSPRIARMIAAFDTAHRIRHIYDEDAFNRDDPDTTIIGRLSQENPRPCLVTSDIGIMRRGGQERTLLKDSGLACIFFKKGFSELKLEEQAWKTVRIWPKLAMVVASCRQPTAFEIGPNARKVELYRLTRDL